MRRNNQSPEVRSSINVTPLVDVVLVLLIIFMVIAPRLQTEAAVDLPRTDRPPDQPDDGRKIVVVVKPGGPIWIDDAETTPEDFAERMRAAAEGREGWKVVIEGDARLTYGEVQQTMFAIEAAGFTDVGLIAMQQEES